SLAFEDGEPNAELDGEPVFIGVAKV
ncbi:MAG: hypothetical protein QOF69_4088, partial [Solirubrobacteraceae bacterium]|nr:hypothetical protein [Solirubrobacteraceae bacterium]